MDTTFLPGSVTSLTQEKIPECQENEAFLSIPEYFNVGLSKRWGKNLKYFKLLKYLHRNYPNEWGEGDEKPPVP